VTSPVSTAPLRTRLLDVAAGILAEEGPQALTVRRVATAAGCSTIGVYTHFDGKDGLIAALLDLGFAGFAIELGRADEVDDPRERLYRSALAYRHWALANPTLFRLMFTPTPGYSPHPDLLERIGQSYRDQLARVESALAAGVLAPGDPDELTRHLWAGVHGRVVLELLGSMGEPGDPAAAELDFRRGLDLLMDGVSTTPGGQDPSRR
jgi:AcrR family transcriptional regulator